MMYNQDKRDLDELQAFVATVEEDGSFGKTMAKMAANLFSGLNKRDSFAYSFYNELSSADTWHAEFNPAIDIVVESLTDTTALEKKASIAAQLGGAFNLLGSAGQGALLAALLTGGVVGGGAWLLNRDVSQDSIENEIIKGKIREYERMSKQIEQKLSNKYKKKDFNEEVDND